MTSPKAPKDKIFEMFINPYLSEVLQHPQSIEMREGMLHIRDVEGPKKTGSMETRLEAMEQQVFNCQGMVERGLSANHMMITEFTNKQRIDANDIGKHLSRLYDRIDHLQAQIYDVQNQNFAAELVCLGKKWMVTDGRLVDAMDNVSRLAWHQGGHNHGDHGAGMPQSALYGAPLTVEPSRAVNRFPPLPKRRRGPS
ncbi:40S ribosomal protein S5-1 [Hordeum vulgare]|nr:40S ribosomal protein S5-1 [Hordeum vulgare]